MKQLLVALLLTLLITPSALAHTQLSSTVPAHGDIVTESLTKISLTYAGQIEEGSHFELTNATGETIEVTSLNVFNGVMTGKVAEPLINGTYTVKWDSISEDGHPLNGTFSFVVDISEALKPVAVEQSATEKEQTEDSEAKKEVVNEQEPAEQSTGILIVVGIFAVIIVASIVVLFTRRKG